MPERATARAHGAAVLARQRSRPPDSAPGGAISRPAKPEPSSRPAFHPARSGGLRIWREVAVVVGFYGVYTLIRNQFGSEIGLSAKEAAIDNARSVIAVERTLHLFVENGIQRAFVDWDLFIRFWNVFYGLGHFAVTIGVMALLYVRSPERYGRWRTSLACTTGLALAGYALFPLMPPRLLNDCGRFGACDEGYTFVDTLKDPGGLWSFDSSAMAEISNQYAAMPSLHVAWAFWCALAAAPMLHRHWSRLAIGAYPWLTVFAVIVTANHYWIDAVGALAVLGVGCVAGAGLCRVLPEWLAPRAEPEQGHADALGEEGLAGSELATAAIGRGSTAGHAHQGRGS